MKFRKKPNKYVEVAMMTINNMVSEPGSNNKKPFAYIKDMKCNSSDLAPLKKDGISYSEPTDQVKILNKQFCQYLHQRKQHLNAKHGNQYS